MSLFLAFLGAARNFTYFCCKHYQHHLITYETHRYIVRKGHMTLDLIDKKLIQYLSTGISSYEELARLCNVTRNTVYRRISSLEKKGIIKNIIRCIINFDKIDITPVMFGAKVPVAEIDKALNLFTMHKKVKLLWRCYGEYNVVFIAFCSKGDEGELIQSILAVFESLNVNDVKVSTGFVWEKTDFAPFEENAEIDFKIEHILKQNH